MSEQLLKERYLDLLKETLTYSLWEEPPRPWGFEFSGKNPVAKYYYSKFLKLLGQEKLQLVKPVVVSSYERENGMIWPGKADTMVGRKRLDNLQFCIETVLGENIEGDFLEAGVWRGGASIFMRGVLAANGVTDRKVYLADSFEGLPRPDEKKCPEDAGDSHHEYGYLAVSLDEVKNNFARYNLLDDQVVFIKGWFEETLPDAPVEKISVLRADGDMYGSTMDILDNLYPKLQSGGFCVIDDYGALKSCRQAVDDYRERNQVTEEIVEIDWTGRYWRKD